MSSTRQRHKGLELCCPTCLRLGGSCVSTSFLSRRTMTRRTYGPQEARQDTERHKLEQPCTPCTPVQSATGMHCGQHMCSSLWSCLHHGLSSVLSCTGAPRRSMCLGHCHSPVGHAAPPAGPLLHCSSEVWVPHHVQGHCAHWSQAPGGDHSTCNANNTTQCSTQLSTVTPRVLLMLECVQVQHFKSWVAIHAQPLTALGRRCAGPCWWECRQG